MWKNIFQEYFVYVAMDSPKKSSKLTYSNSPTHKLASLDI